MYEAMLYTISKFWNFLSLHFFGQGDISQESMLWELQFKLYFSGTPGMYDTNGKF